MKRVDHWIFQHIPKTAGSTIHAVLDNQYPAAQIHSTFAATMDDKELDRLRQLSETERKGLKLVKGHMPFGVHTLLPGRSRYLTFLRHPIDRIISNYYFILNNPQNTGIPLVMLRADLWLIVIIACYFQL